MSRAAAVEFIDVVVLKSGYPFRVLCSLSSTAVRLTERSSFSLVMWAVDGSEVAFESQDL